MTQEQINRYNDLYKMIKSGKAYINGKPSNKLSDLKKIEYEFRTTGPLCGKAQSCKECSNYIICWE